MSPFTTRYSQLALSISLLLSGTTALSAPNNKSEDKKTHIGDINVSDKSDTDTQGYDNIYDKDISNVYLGKEEIERFKGTSPGDLFKGTVGVFSGEARNGGAIDPNIRGIQGQGRIPITVDGTEQAITAYRGYYGASNRNYLDPNMIRSVEIEKGSSLSNNMRSSVGGGIAIETIRVDDVVKEGDNFGINVLMEMSNNSIKPRLPYLIYGEDYRNSYHRLLNRYAFDDKDINIHTSNRKKHTLHGIDDSAYRVGLGFRQERFDFMLAFSHRKSGNFFSGHRGSNNYSEPFTEEDKERYSAAPDAHSERKSFVDPFLPFAANIYRPGHEVLNTSNTMETLLVKNNWRISDEQALNFTFRNTQSQFGDIMPSRLSMFVPENNLLPQWPEGRIYQKAGSINYKFKSKNNAYLNLSSSLWFNHTDGKLNTAGGFPRYPTQMDFVYENIVIDRSLIDTASNHTHNNRWGVDLKNEMQLAKQTKLSLFGNFQNEKLTNGNPFESNYKIFTFSPPREGRRQEYHLGFNINWTPIERLSFNAGAQYNSYWSIDDFVNKHRAKKNGMVAKNQERLALSTEYYRAITVGENDDYNLEQSLYKEYSKLKKEKNESEKNGILFSAIKQDKINQLDKERASIKARYEWGFFRSTKELRKGGLRYQRITFEQPVDKESGQVTKEQNSFYNGDIDINEKVFDPYIGEFVNKYIVFQINNAGDPVLDFMNTRNVHDLYAQNPKRSNSDWAPVLAASLNITDDWRLYVRYAEAIRMPSIYEDTSNFAGAQYTKAGKQFEPERSRTFEVGNVYDLSSLLNTKNHADIKISYFDTQLENVFERNSLAQRIQLDKQLISGIELQARYDNGLFFSNISTSYNFKTKVCDEDSYISYNMFNNLNIPHCIDGGYPGGFLRTALPPKYSIHGNFGVRLMDEKLKLGGRFVYHSRVINKDEVKLQKLYPSYFLMGTNNNPVRWNQVFTLDTYISYKFTPDTTIELIGTNMLDEYFLDPLTRSMMPAPGRTFKLMLTSQF